MSESVALVEAFAPAGWVALGAVALVLADALSHTERAMQSRSRIARLRQTLLAVSSAAFVSLAFIMASSNLLEATGRQALPGGMLSAGTGAHFATALLCVAALLVIAFAASGPPESGAQRSEFHSLLLLSLTGCLLTVSAGHLVSLYLAVELATLPAAALLSLERGRERGIEAGTRLLVVLGFASAISLYGLALLYGATGDLSFTHLAQHALGADGSDPLAAIGLALLCVGLLARLAIAPFHYWLPNITDGATPIAAAWASCVVVGAVALAFVQLVLVVWMAAPPELTQALRGFAMLSMVLGSGLALLQSSVKRLLAYGAVVHAGLFLAALMVAPELGAPAAVIEMATFVLMQLGAFGVLSIMTQERGGGVQLGEFAGLAERAPILAGAFALFLLGLAGLPGTVGFISRFHLLQVMIEGEQILLACVAGASTVVLFAAYLRVAVAMYMLRGRNTVVSVAPLPATLALLFCALGTLAFGILPSGGLMPFDLLETIRLATRP